MELSVSSREVLVDFARNEHVIVYKRLRNRGVVGTRLKLRGNMESCYTEVPAQRLLQSSHAGNASGPHSNDDSKYLLKLAQEYSREICGVISSNRTAPLPKTFCDLIRIQENNVTQCIPLKDNSLFVPLGVHSLELKVVNNMSESQVLEFEEVSCADVI